MYYDVTYSNYSFVMNTHASLVSDETDFERMSICKKLVELFKLTKEQFVYVSAKSNSANLIIDESYVKKYSIIGFILFECMPFTKSSSVFLEFVHTLRELVKAGGDISLPATPEFESVLNYVKIMNNQYSICKSNPGWDDFLNENNC